MANYTGNTAAAIRGQVFSTLILQAIEQGFLSEGLYRDVSDFGDGETLFIPVIGEVTIRDVEENTPVKYDPIDTGRIPLEITQFKSGASYVTKKLQDDGYIVSAIEAEIPKQHLRKIKEAHETDMLAQANKQTLGNPNVINQFAHRFVANNGTTTGLLTLEDIAYAKLALDKAGVPQEGRIGIVDPIVEMTLNLEAGKQGFINNPKFEGIVNTGFARNNKFLWNIFGFDIYTSDRLPRIASETITGGPHSGAQALTNGVVNQFMSVADDSLKPYMGAWRRQPVSHGEYNKDFDRDEYVTYARWGFGLQRPETLVSILTRQDIYK